MRFLSANKMSRGLTDRWHVRIVARRPVRSVCDAVALPDARIAMSLWRILSLLAVISLLSPSVFAQRPVLGPPETRGAVVNAGARGVELGKPIILASYQPEVSTIMPTPAELGSAPEGPSSMPSLDGSCCEPCSVCGPPGRVWSSFEWLYWVTSGQPVPVLATAALPNTPRDVAGIPGLPTTATLFGGERVNNDWRNGFRATAGFWCDEAQTCGIELDFLFLERSRTPFGIASEGSSIITRPFFNVTTLRPDVELVSFPGILAGSLAIDATNRVIGGGVNLLKNLCCDPCSRTDLILGYRYLNVADSLTITENLYALPESNVPRGTQFRIVDQFKTSNNFHGGVIGLATEQARGPFFIGLRATVALGTNYQITTINGSTTVLVPGSLPVTYPGGLLTQVTNIGRYTSSQFAVLPEVGIKLGVQLTPNARVYAGYNFLYLSNVVRAGDQIDPRVNTTLLPPPTAYSGLPLPTYQRQTTDFWMQGISLGAELRF